MQIPAEVIAASRPSKSVPVAATSRSSSTWVCSAACLEIFLGSRFAVRIRHLSDRTAGHSEALPSHPMGIETEKGREKRAQSAPRRQVRASSGRESNHADS
jgi:hypothetical protein